MHHHAGRRHEQRGGHPLALASVRATRRSHAAASASTVCSGYMVEWLRLEGPPPPPPPAAESGGDGATQPSAGAVADARADDGLEFVPAEDMHGGRFEPA